MFPCCFHTVGCKPLSVSSDFNTSAFIFSRSNSSLSPGNASLSVRDQQGLRGNSSEPVCMRSPTVLRDEQDVLSLRFIVSSNLSVTSDLPTVLTLDLDSSADSGGTFVVQLLLNTVSIYVCIINDRFKFNSVVMHNVIVTECSDWWISKCQRMPHTCSSHY